MKKTIFRLIICKAMFLFNNLEVFILTKDSLTMIEQYLYCIKEDFKNALNEPNAKIKNLKLLQSDTKVNNSISSPNLNIEISYYKENDFIELNKKNININLENENLFTELTKLKLGDKTAKDICKLIFNYTDILRVCV